MDLSNADLVKALRCCARYAYNCEGCVALPVCDAQDYFGVELIAADRIEQLAEEIDALKSDLDSVTRDGNPFQAIMLREKWGLRHGESV